MATNGGGGDDSLFPYRIGQSQQTTPQSSADSLSRSAQDLRGADLETTDSPWPANQQRPASFGTLVEPYSQFAAEWTANIAGQIEVAEAPAAQTQSPASTISSAQDSQQNTDQVNCPGSQVCSVSRSASAPSRCSQFRRENGPTTPQGLSPVHADSDRSEVTEDATTGEDVSLPAGQPAEQETEAETKTNYANSSNSASGETSCDEEVETAEEGSASAAASELPAQIEVNNNAAQVLVGAVATEAKPETLEKPTGLVDAAANMEANPTNVTVHLVTENRHRQPLQQQQQQQQQHSHFEHVKNFDKLCKSEASVRSDTPSGNNLERHKSAPPSCGAVKIAGKNEPAGAPAKDDSTPAPPELPMEVSQLPATPAAEAIVEPEHQTGTPQQGDCGQPLNVTLVTAIDGENRSEAFAEEINKNQQQAEQNLRQDEMAPNPTSHSELTAPQPPHLLQDPSELASLPATELRESSVQEAKPEPASPSADTNSRRSTLDYNANASQDRVRRRRQPFIYRLRNLFRRCIGRNNPVTD